MAKFLRQREDATTATAVATPSSHDVQPLPNIFKDDIGRENTKNDNAQSQSNIEDMPSKVSAQPIPQPHADPNQQRLKIWMGTKMLKEQATQSLLEPKKEHCYICTPNGRVCLHTWHRFTAHLDLEGSDKVSNWDADIEEAANYGARAPLGRPRQL